MRLIRLLPIICLGKCTWMEWGISPERSIKIQYCNYTCTINFTGIRFWSRKPDFLHKWQKLKRDRNICRKQGPIFYPTHVVRIPLFQRRLDTCTGIHQAKTSGKLWQPRQIFWCTQVVIKKKVLLVLLCTFWSFDHNCNGNWCDWPNGPQCTFPYNEILPCMWRQRRKRGRFRWCAVSSGVKIIPHNRLEN